MRDESDGGGRPAPAAKRNPYLESERLESERDEPNPQADLETRLERLTARVDALETALWAKTERVETLEATVEAQATRLADLERRVDDQEEALERHDERLEHHEQELERHRNELEGHEQALEAHTQALETQDDRLERHDDRLETVETKTTTTATKTEAALKKADANKHRIRELQTRELEKGAHLRTTTVDPAEVDPPNDRLEKLTGDDGETYYRLPDRDDPLTDVTPRLAHGDLLPIQQLARLDEDMRRSTTSALPTRLAAALWAARSDPTIGDDPWNEGCKNVREYVTASDLKHWIRRQETGISESYAKKLVSRTIDAILELSTNRLAVRKRTQRKNGLEYTERRLILPADAEIPGESIQDDETRPVEPASPETTDVHG